MIRTQSSGLFTLLIHNLVPYSCLDLWRESFDRKPSLWIRQVFRGRILNWIWMLFQGGDAMPICDMRDAIVGRDFLGWGEQGSVVKNVITSQQFNLSVIVDLLVQVGLKLPFCIQILFFEPLFKHISLIITVSFERLDSMRHVLLTKGENDYKF